jgi:hypothetical protein
MEVSMKQVPLNQQNRPKYRALALFLQHNLRDLGKGLPAEQSETIQQAITYLEHQRPWIGSYEHWRKRGYPVGSGMIERAVTLVINRRMKKRGMRWCRPNATAIVALRTALLNDDWVTPQRLRAFP